MSNSKMLTEALENKIYRALRKLPEFKNLSMDRQGEIVIKIVMMMSGKK